MKYQKSFRLLPSWKPYPKRDPPYLDIGESKDDIKEGDTKQTDSFEDEEKHQHHKLSVPAELQSPKMIIEEQMDKVVTKMEPLYEEPIIVKKNENDGATLIERDEDSWSHEKEEAANLVKKEIVDKLFMNKKNEQELLSDNTSEAKAAEEKPEAEAKNPEELDLITTGTTYRIQMSLCGDSVFGKDEQENARVFDEHISTYDNFTHNPNMLNDKRLVFRYENRYFAAGHTGPLFTSLFLFKKPLEDTSETSESDSKVSDSRESYQFGKGWRQWLSRSSVAAPTGMIETEQTEATPRHSEDTNAGQDITTFTTTTTTTSVGWSADHVHPGQEQPEAFPGPRKVYAKTLRLTSDQLKSLNLKKGANTISFSVSSAYQGTATCAAKIFYWNYGYSVVISDIDGTITKSDALGHVFTMIGKDWTHMGVAKLYTDIANNGYHFLYLTSRAIGQADYTRDYLKKVAQDKYQLPDGPVIMSPDRLFTSFHREVIIRKPEVFKMACLRDVQRLFGGRDPFYAGFGNRITDARSYRSVNVPTSRIFTIDPYGDLKLELLMGFKSSYIHLNDLVDQIFPPINRVIDEEYTDWNFWKSPFPEIDIPELDIPLEPTSPKPKPIKPDPSVLPSSSVVASASSSSRSLLRSFTSRSDSSSSLQSNRKLQSSSSTPTVLKSPKVLANDNEVTSDQKAAVVNTGDVDDNSSLLSTSPPTSASLMNKVSSGFGGVRSTLSRTFLSSSENGSSKSIKEDIKKEEVADVKKEADVKEDEEEEDESKQDVDSLLDDIDMDDIPFI
ncbi:Lipin/Ned1/Smp2-domain-containing protein [Mucor mucedo]|uniref:Lipin/Ned1/Smp2-domain-containing protein n=1 Tax=Mucor mucedo TaxID=29922 RepID=UPI00221E6694|nr:Lipin/Ned1/Smp2-domain-containing protein [Mucor mucedo]KAI7894934.1 Lipin/Ned1/Smp2-domain-containing protein [Mucor mucedo]